LSSAIQQAATDVSNIASVIGSVVPALLPTLGLPAATVATATTDVGTVTKDAQTISGAVAAASTPSGGVVQEFGAAASAAIGVVLPLLDATVPEVAVLTAAVALLPTVLSAFGIASASAVSVVPPDAARSIITQYLSTHATKES